VSSGGQFAFSPIVPLPGPRTSVSQTQRAEHSSTTSRPSLTSDDFNISAAISEERENPAPEVDANSPPSTTTESQSGDNVVLNINTSVTDSHAASTSFRVVLLEELKCAIKGSELKSQLMGMVRVQGGGGGEEIAKGQGQLAVKLNLQTPAKELVFNPNIQHTAQESGGGSTEFVFIGTHASDHPTVLLKYRLDGFQLPLVVKAKTVLRSSSSSFVMLSADVALNQAYAARQPTVTSVAVSLKALSHCRVIDVRGKQGPAWALQWDAESLVATWSGAGSAGILNFAARIEVEAVSGDLDNATAPVSVSVRFPQHPVSTTAISVSNPAGTGVDYLSKVEYSFF
jgi:hypothetical protein